jgi:hypothetical protein
MDGAGQAGNDPFGAGEWRAPVLRRGRWLVSGTEHHDGAELRRGYLLRAVLRDFVWDQGDSIVLEWFGADYGLELPKAPRFSSDATPWFLFSDVVYHEAAPCLNDAGQVVFLDVFEPF